MKRYYTKLDASSPDMTPMPKENDILKISLQLSKNELETARKMTGSKLSATPSEIVRELLKQYKGRNVINLMR